VGLDIVCESAQPAHPGVRLVFRTHCVDYYLLMRIIGLDIWLQAR
jgi:hypothetical protein